MADEPAAEGRAPAGEAEGRAPAGGEEAARRLFRYVAFDEWREYRAIMAVFAGTFFAEFSPEEVTARLGEAGQPLDGAVVADRLESLRGWGNLTVSSSVGAPRSLADYYKRRNRYLITRAGQEVHDVVEGVLTRVDEVRDVSTSRLRALQDALAALVAADVATADPGRLADLVRAVFDPHEAFTSEITQFFAALNQWQNRYDLSAEEFAFFAEVLVGYVAERLEEIERTARPIARHLEALAGRVPLLVERAGRGLAARVEAAGLAGSVSVARAPGSTVADWQLLAAWFVPEPARPSRLARLGADAVSAIRTLTLNLTRLSRVGVGASSRRADFLRLARLFDAAAGSAEAARLAAAAFGLYPSQHLGVLAEDADDPVATTTSWAEAPRALVPVSLRERGDTTNRGRASPMADRAQAQRAVRQRREREADAARRVDAELLAAAAAGLDGAELSAAALARLQQLVALVVSELGVRSGAHERADGGVACRVARTPGRATVLRSPDGRLTFVDLEVQVAAAVPIGAGGG